MKFISAILLLGIQIHINSVTYAQSEHIINFLEIKNASLTHTFKYNEKARVKIININRFIYNINEEKTEEDFNTNIPSILSSIKLPSFLTSQLSTDAPPSNEKKLTTNQSPEELKKDLEIYFKRLIKVCNKINEFIDTHNMIVHIMKDCEKPFATIEKNAKSTLTKHVEGKIDDSISALADKMENLLLNDINMSNEIVNDMEELLKAWKNKSLTITRENQTMKSDSLARLNIELNKMQSNKIKNEISINAKNKEIRDLELIIKQIEEDAEIEEKENEVIIEKARKIVEEINKYKEDGKYLLMVDDIRKVNESNYTYYTGMVILKKDEYRFKLNITSNEQLPCNLLSSQKFETILRTRGGVKLDFSTGAFLMSGKADFFGRSYYYQPTNQTQSVIAVADYGKRTLLGIGALMHIYKRSPSNLKVGGAIGVSSTFNFDALNFHAGASFLIGDKDRICFSTGITAREVDLLDNRYKIDQVYNKEDLPGEIPTFKKFPNYGWFISLTYNVSRFNK